MRMPALSAFVALCLACSPALAEHSYLCIADSSIGYKADPSTKEWGPVAFRAGDRFVLRPLNADEIKQYTPFVKPAFPTDPDDMGFFRMGESIPLGTCRWHVGIAMHSFSCNPYGTLVYVNLDRLRFQVIGPGSYTWDEKDGRTPNDGYMEIGKCSSIN